MSEFKRSEFIPDDLLMAPLILKKNMQDLLVTLKEVREVSVMFGKSIDSTQSTTKLKDETTKLVKESNELKKVSEALAVAMAKDNNLYRQQSAELTKVRNELKTKTAIGDADAKSVNKQNASVVQLGAALNANRAAYASLRSEEARNSKDGQDLLKVIQQQDEEYKSLKSSIGQNQDKVGDYIGALSLLKKELKAAKGELSTLDEGSDAYIVASKKAGELSDKIGDINDNIKASAGDTTIENLGSRFGLLGGKLKNLDFKGASNQIKSISELSKGMTFKEATSGIGELGKGFGTLSKAIFTNPLFLIAAIVIGVVLAVNALKDKLKPLVIAFEYVGKAIDFVVQAAKDFSDAMGLSSFAAEDNAKRVVAAAEKQQKKLEERYDDEIKLAQAAGKWTYDLERSKQRAIEGTSEKIIKALEKQKAAGSKLSEDQQQQLEDYTKKAHDASIEIIAITLREAQELKGMYDEAAKARTERLKKASDDEKEAAFKLAQWRLQNEIKIQQDIYNNQVNAFADRNAAAIAAEKLRVQLVGLESDHEIDKAKGINSAVKLAREKAAADILEITKESLDQQQKLQVDFHNQEADLEDKAADNFQNSFAGRLDAVGRGYSHREAALKASLDAELITQEQYDQSLEELATKTTDKLIKINIDRVNKLAEIANNKNNAKGDGELEALNDKFKKGEVSLLQYNKKRKDIQDGYQAEALKNQLGFLNQELEDAKTYGADTSAIEAQLADVSLQLSQQEADKKVEIKNATNQALNDLATGAQNAALQIIDDQNAAEDEKRQKRLEQIQTTMDAELAAAGDNETAKLAIKQKAEAETQKVRLAQAAADRKRAIFEKAAAAVSIVINTLKGVGMALGTYPPPASFVLAAITAALGAVQVAAVLSKPIPSYAVGTENHPGGFAEVGERGMELVTLPGGKSFLTKNSSSVLDLPKGTKVKTHEQTLKDIALNSLRPDDNVRGSNSDVEHFDKLGNRIDHLIQVTKNKKEQHWNIDRQGMQAMVKNAETREYFMNQLYR